MQCGPWGKAIVDLHMGWRFTAQAPDLSRQKIGLNPFSCLEESQAPAGK